MDRQIKPRLQGTFTSADVQRSEKLMPFERKMLT